MCSTLPLLPRLMDCCRVRCSLALDSYRWPRLVLPRNEMVPNGKLWRNGCICRLYVDIQISYPDNQVPWSMDLLKHIKDFSNNNCNMSNFSQAKWNYLLFTQAFLIDRLRYLTAWKSRFRLFQMGSCWKMVGLFHGKSHKNGWFGGSPISGNTNTP